MIERRLAPFVGTLLEREGYNLIIPSGGRLDGKGEFSIEVPGTGKVRRVDAVAARYENERHIKAVAVECKATVWAVYDGLGQAVQYQSLFDEVYVATPVTLELDRDSIARSTLVDLGLGHIRVDEEGKSAYISVVPQTQRSSRFEPHRKATRISCRLGLGLAFLGMVAPERRMRYGFWEGGLAVWYAEDVTGHLQWNCWHDCRGERADEMGAGVNVERTEDIRTICSAVSADSLSIALARVPEPYSVEVGYDPVPAVPGKPSVDVLHIEARRANANEVLRLLKSYPAKSRPHLRVTYRMLRPQWDNFSRPDYKQLLLKVRQELRPVMEVLQACYG